MKNQTNLMHFEMEVDVDDVTRASMSTKKFDVEAQISPALLVFCGGPKGTVRSTMFELVIPL